MKTAAYQRVRSACWLRPVRFLNQKSLWQRKLMKSEQANCSTRSWPPNSRRSFRRKPVSQRDFRAAAIIVAAGSGERLGAQKPKALVELAGIPLVVRAVRGIIDSHAARSLVLTAPLTHVEEDKRVLKAEPGTRTADETCV